MVFGSLVVLHDWLHSCLCFSLLEKLFSKSLLDTWLSVELSSFFSYRNLDTSSTPSGSIKKVPVSSIASRQLGRSIKLLCLIWWVVPQHLLDTFICQWPFSRHLPWQLAQCLSTPTSIEIYWWPIYSPHATHNLFLSISFSMPLSFQLPNLFHSLQSSSSRFLQVFSRFSSLGKLLISHIHAFHVLKPRI